MARTIEGKIAYKKNTLSSAERRLEAARAALFEAEAEMERATLDRDDRASELRSLEAELVALPMEVGACPALAALPQGLRGDAEAVAAHELLAAKLRQLSATEAAEAAERASTQQPAPLQPDPLRTAGDAGASRAEVL